MQGIFRKPLRSPGTSGEVETSASPASMGVETASPAARQRIYETVAAADFNRYAKKPAGSENAACGVRISHQETGSVTSSRTQETSEIETQDETASTASVDSIEQELLEFQISEAQTRMDSRDWPGAEESISSLLSNASLKPSKKWAWTVKRITVLWRQKKWEDMLIALDMEEYPDPALGNCLTAQAYLALGRTEEARVACARAIKMARKDAKLEDTLNRSMWTMAQIMDVTGKKVEGRFYRSKLPRGYAPDDMVGDAEESATTTPEVSTPADDSSKNQPAPPTRKLKKEPTESSQPGTTKARWTKSHVKIEHDCIRLWENAMAKNDENLAEALLKEPNLPRSERSSDGATALHFAARYNRVKYIKHLVSAGADLEAQILGPNRHGGETPLHVASMYNLESTRALLDIGADVSAETTNGMTPIFYAILQNSIEAIMLLRSKGASTTHAAEKGVTPLHYAAIHATDVNVLRCIVVNMGPVSAVDEIGDTPLHAALRESIRPNAKFLVSRGAPLEHANAHGERPLHYAALFADAKTVRWLLSQGVSARARAFDGNTALHYAMFNKKDDDEVLGISDALLKKGLDADEEGEGGVTAVTLARKMGRTKVVKLIETYYKT